MLKGGVFMADKKLQIKRNNLRGEDNHKIFSIRIENELAEKLDNLSKETSRSRNDLINILLKFAIDNCEIIE